MSIKLFSLALLVFIFLSSHKNETAIKKYDPVNLEIGDLGSAKISGWAYPMDFEEVNRIQSHLEYVELYLTNQNTSHLNQSQKRNREKAIALLNKYRKNGQFPSNYDFPGDRKPCFIDKTGNICAVGYLLEQTEGRQAAEAINEKHQYHYIYQIYEPELIAWAETNGLTIEECAMIQPTYSWDPPPAQQEDELSVPYGVFSAMLGGTNVAISSLNIMQLSAGRLSLPAPIVGLITGSGQMALGFAKFQSGDGFSSGSLDEKIALFNIGLGTTSMILSGYNLIANKRPKDNNLSWNVFSYPTTDRQLGVGFYLSKSF